MRWIALAFAVGLIGCSESSKRRSEEPIQAVDHLDINRYQGRWYEIARFPFSIQKGCVATTATYTLRDDHRLDVLNECRKGGFDGDATRAKGIAEIVDSAFPAKLKVSFNFFMGLFGGANYWVIDLAKNYSYAVVSEPDGRYLWILSRTPQMDKSVYKQIIDRLRSDGFMVEYLELTPQVAIKN